MTQQASKDDPTLHIYTDGACSGNPGFGGWACVLLYRGYKKELSGGCVSTTNNRMELTAVIEALRCLKQHVPTIVYSDSSYVVNAFNQGWVISWQANNWLNSTKKEVSNKDLWQDLISLVEEYNVTFVKVKGHSDNQYNNRCDELAVAEWKKLKQQAVPKF